MLLTSVFTLASCMGNTTTTPPVTNTCTNHVDADHDGKCDVQGCTGTVAVKHVDAKHDGKCDTCGKTVPVVHGTPDEDYKCPTCGKVIEHECVDEDPVDAECDLCGETVEHTCVDEEFDTFCDICSKPMPKVECEQHIDYVGSDSICDVCGERFDCDCVDVDGDRSCDICQAYVAPAEEDFNYEWEKTDLLVQLTENTNTQEILSVSRKYLAGDSLNGGDQIQALALQRNLKAQDKTKVNITYTYYPDNPEFNWGQNIERIEDTNRKGIDVPDIYTNFIYDMVGASLKNCFANLLANNISATRGENHFAFVSDDEFDAKRDDRGFMYEYMQSLTLAPTTKMYVLSSDYFIDMVRAFFCVPVSVKLMEDAGQAVVAGQDPDGNPRFENGDRDDSGAYDFNDFYEMVWDGEWTYKTVAKFSDAVWKPATTNDGSCLLTDDIVGFAMSAGGLSASGLLYTTSVEMIKKEELSDGTYKYTYPRNNTDFFAFCDATTDLFKNSEGVCFVKETYGLGSKSYLAIRTRFTQGNVLFGDVMLVGGLEFTEYQEMKTNGGFGIVPVPLFRAGDTYQTQIHNIGVCGAISATTQKFSQCTAFLNYQSTHSEDILNQYYEFKLQYDLSSNAGEDAKGNTVEMLGYIRDHVRSSFDKAMEDALYVFNQGEGGTGEENRWHSILSTYGFQVDIRSEYDKKYSTKQGLLDALAAAFKDYAD